MSIRAEQKPLGELLSGARQFVIPEYQRPYVWKVDNTHELVSDLLQSWEAGGSECFLGSIVTIGKESSAELDVIDGQQRLTTLCILLAALRHFSAEQHQQERITGLLTSTQINEYPSSRPRLAVRNRDASFFERYIIDGDISTLRDLADSPKQSDSQRRMRQNLEVIIDALNEHLDENQFVSFVEYLSSKVLMVLVETDDFLSAHRIFGVLNTRGVPLTAADVFKARVLGTVASRNSEKYAADWDRALEPFTGEEDRFFQNLLVLQTKNTARRALVDEFIDRVLSKYSAVPEGEDFMETVFLKNAASYAQLHGKNADVTQACRWPVELLRHYPATDWTPVAMLILGSELEPTQKRELLLKLERVYGVYYVAGVSAEQRGQRMVALLRAITEWVEFGEPLGEQTFGISDDIRQRAIIKAKSELPATAIRMILMKRALAHTQGNFVGLMRAARIRQVLPPARVPGVDDSVQLDAWRSRLAGMALTTVSSAQVARAKDWMVIADRLRDVHKGIESSACVFPLGQKLTEQLMEQRQADLVGAIADFWEIRRDSDGVDLVSLTESQLIGTRGGKKLARTKRTTIADLLTFGLLSEGDTLVWHRRNIGDVHAVTVTALGTLKLADGSEVASPTAAVQAIAESRASALDAFVRESDGTPLRDLWNTYERRFKK